MYYDKIVRSDDLVLTATLDDAVAHSPDLAGHLSVGGSGVIVETQIENDTVSAVIGLYAGSTELGTITLDDNTAKGKFIHFAPVSVSPQDVYFPANTNLTIKTKTAGTDSGTAAGRVIGVFAVSHND